MIDNSRIIRVTYKCFKCGHEWLDRPPSHLCGSEVVETPGYHSQTTDMQERVMAVFREGTAAHDAGIPVEHCPHSLRLFHHAWKAGWHKGELRSLGHKGFADV